MDERQGTKFHFFYGLKDDEYDHVLKNFEKVVEHPTGYYFKYESHGETIILIATKAFYIEYFTGTQCRLVFGDGAKEIVKDVFRRHHNFILPVHYEPQHFAGKKKLDLDEGCKLKNLSSHSQLLVVSRGSWTLYDCLKNSEKAQSLKFVLRFRLNVSKKFRGLGLKGVNRIQYVKFETQNPMFAACALSSLWITQQTLIKGIRGTYTKYGLLYLKFKDNVCELIDKRGANKCGGKIHWLEYWKMME